MRMKIDFTKTKANLNNMTHKAQLTNLARYQTDRPRSERIREFFDATGIPDNIPGPILEKTLELIDLQDKQRRLYRDLILSLSIKQLKDDEDSEVHPKLVKDTVKNPEWREIFDIFFA